jgi:hypothetical protein
MPKINKVNAKTKGYKNVTLTKGGSSARDQAIAEAQAEMIAEGYVLCEKCSNGNWTVLHAPGVKCPKEN